MYVQRAIILSVFLLIQFISSCSGTPSFGIENEAREKFARLPGTLFINFKTAKSNWSFSITHGKFLKTDAFPGLSTRAQAPALNDFDISNLLSETDMYYRGPCLVSADKSLAVAGIEYKGANLSLSSDFIIADVKDNKILFKRKSSSLRIIEDIAWSPDSEYFAVLQKNEKAVFSLEGIVSSMAGHPVRSNTYYLQIYNRQGQIYAQSEVASRLVGSSVKLFWDFGDAPLIIKIP